MSLSNIIKRIVPDRYHLPITFYRKRVQRALEPEMLLLPELVGSGRRAIDVGANLGLYTYALSRLFESVDAFEPVPDYCERLSKQRLRNVKVHNVALSDIRGVLPLNVPVGNNFGESPSLVDHGFERIRIDVPARPLDDCQFTDVSFIKIDVEGYELKVLRGAAQTIRTCRPIMLIEIEQRHLKSPISDVFAEVLNLGYRGYFLRNSQLASIAEFSHERDQAPYVNNLRDDKYINNFIFKPVQASSGS